MIAAEGGRAPRGKWGSDDRLVVGARVEPTASQVIHCEVAVGGRGDEALAFLDVEEVRDHLGVFCELERARPLPHVPHAHEPVVVAARHASVGHEADRVDWRGMGGALAPYACICPHVALLQRRVRPAAEDGRAVCGKACGATRALVRARRCEAGGALSGAVVELQLARNERGGEHRPARVEVEAEGLLAADLGERRHCDVTVGPAGRDTSKLAEKISRKPGPDGR